MPEPVIHATYDADDSRAIVCQPLAGEATTEYREVTCDRCRGVIERGERPEIDLQVDMTGLTRVIRRPHPIILGVDLTGFDHVQHNPDGSWWAWNDEPDFILTKPYPLGPQWAPVGYVDETDTGESSHATP